MSNVDSTQQPKTLEEAIQEIDSLRSQLSGSDLKVFSQNRELRVENQKLKEEIRQLTEQCVSQTFKVRGLEKSEEKLKGEVAEAQTRIGELETKVTDLGGELEEYRSKEINLSQELEATVRSNAEALEKLLAEHSHEVEAKSAEYQAALSEKESAIQQLEQRVEQFKEEFLSQELVVGSSAPAVEGDTRAFELLSQKMEDFLGFPGRALVEQVFRLSGVEPDSSNPSELEETFEVLQDTASQLVQDEEQEQELASILESAWSELGLADGVPVTKETDPGQEPTVEEVSPAPEEAEPVAEAAEETQPSDEISEAPVDVQPEVVSEGAATAAPEEVEPAVEEQAEIAPPEENEPALEESAEADSAEQIAEPPTVEATDETPEEVAVAEEATEISATEETESAAEESAEAATEEVAEEPAEVASEEAAEKASEESAEAASEEAAEASPEEAAEEAPEEAAEEAPEEAAEEAPEEASEAAPEEAVEAAAEDVAEATQSAVEETEVAAGEVTADFELAATHLEEGRHAEALPIFELLQQEDPSEPTHVVGRIACLAGLSRFQEAYDLGKELNPEELGESQDVFQESMEAALVGLASSTESELVKKECLLELLLRAKPDEQVTLYLDEADEIPVRIAREGELSLMQATHRISQDDVTEYLIDALHSLHNRPAVFSLLKTNLERYPELQPLSDFMERLLDSPRAEALEAESAVRELLGQGEAVEDLLDETDPGEEAVVQVFLEHLIPRSGVECEIPSEEFEELMLDAEPAAFVGSLRQALRSVDYTVFFEEIEVLSYDGDEKFLLRSSPEPKPTLLFGEDLDDVPPEELRFLVLRELFSMYRRHSHLKHISAGLDDQKRVELVRACLEIFSEFESQVPEDTHQQLEILKGDAEAGGQSAEFRSKLEAFLREVYLDTESDSFLELGDFLYNEQLNRKWLDSISDNFGAKQTGMVVASYSICRDLLEEEEFEELEESGFGWLYAEENLSKYPELRLRLQRLWSAPLKALISEPEE